MVTRIGRWGRAALLAAALLGGGAGAAAAQEAGRVVGRVTDATGRPVEGATVVAVADSAGRRWTARSERTGGFQLAGLPAGEYRVRVEHGAYGGSEHLVRVEPGGRRTVIVRLREQGSPPAAARSRLRP